MKNLQTVHWLPGNILRSVVHHSKMPELYTNIRSVDRRKKDVSTVQYRQQFPEIHTNPIRLEHTTDI